MNTVHVHELSIKKENILTPMSHMEFGCPEIWGLEPPTPHTGK